MTLVSLRISELPCIAVLVDKDGVIYSISNKAKDSEYFKSGVGNIKEIFDSNINISDITNNFVCNIKNKNTVIEVVFYKVSISSDRFILFIEDDSRILIITNKFIQNIGRETKGPLNGVIGMVSLISNTDLDENQTNYVSILETSAFNLMSVINDIIDYTRLESGRLELILSPFYIRDCLEKSHDIISDKAISKDIEMSFSVDKSVAGCFIGDTKRIQQILINLYSNSIKFTDNGGSIYTKVSLDEESNRIVFSVKDTGIGIPKLDENILFRSYSQLISRGINGNKEGSGLGLAICKKLAQLMNGFIFLDNNVSEGAKFVLSIPLTLPKDNEFIEDNSIVDKNKIKGKTVLLVDENVEDRVKLMNILKKWGIISIPASSIDEMLILLETTLEIDLILLDIDDLKDGSGKKIKTRVPIVGISSIGDKVSSNSGELFNYIISKPVSEVNIISLINRVLVNDVIGEGDAEVKYIFKENKTKILIDEYILVSKGILLSHLKNLGFDDITVSRNGSETTSLIFSKKFDICFINIKPQKINRFTLVEKCRKTSKYVPYFIAMSGIESSEGEFAKINGVFDNFLDKPVKMNDLKEVLGDYVSQLKE